MGNAFTKLLFHVVFSTKYRQPLIHEGMREELYAYMEDTLRRRDGVLLAIGGMPDHVHLLVRLKADMAVSKIVQAIKAHSSKWIHTHPNLPREFAWQNGYGAFSVSESRSREVWRYIQSQEEHHRQVSYETELRSLLARHRVAFDPASLLG